MKACSYKDKIFETINSNRTIKEEAKEIGDRLKYFYMKINGTYDFATPHECQVYPLVLDLLEKIDALSLGDEQ